MLSQMGISPADKVAAILITSVKVPMLLLCKVMLSASIITGKNLGSYGAGPPSCCLHAL